MESLIKEYQEEGSEIELLFGSDQDGHDPESEKYFSGKEHARCFGRKSQRGHTEKFGHVHFTIHLGASETIMFFFFIHGSDLIKLNPPLDAITVIITKQCLEELLQTLHRMLHRKGPVKL